ncbi:DUF6049 family protein [Streptomyces sp. NPDC052301]|uniref:DUF6049 family protein n=1 Tax=Streptomyces sp. NPDC052301 TaxID=3365687 RepID=UPI0037D06BF2
MAEAADFQGTSASPARRWLRRTGAVFAGVPLLAGLLQLPAASPAQAASTDTVAVALDSLTPSAPTDGDTLTVSGTVTNNGKQAVTGAHVDLRIGPMLNTRSAIDAIAQRSDDPQGGTGSEVGDKYAQKFPKLSPGVAQHFSISVPVDKLNLGEDGVYEFGVSASGQTAAQPWDRMLGIQKTFLPWQPSDADTKTKTTFLWPLLSTVHMTAKTGAGELQTPVFLNDDLAKELAPGGRLAQMVTLGKDLDVTWVIDPDLLASVDAMATGNYRLPGDKGTTTPGPRDHQAIAKQWLANLQKAVAGKEVVALPFADPDLASLAHNGTSVAGSLSHLKDATDVAATTVKTVLHVTPSTDFAWPVDGAVDRSIMKVATSAGADRVIARSDSLQETAGLPYTPSAARPVGGGTTAVVADARLSRAFEGNLSKADSATRAVQQFLAQSLEVNAQTDNQRSIVVAPQRMPTASQAQAMAAAVKALQGGTWNQSQDLAAAAKDKPDPNATTRIPSTSAYPSSLRRQELPGSAFGQVARTQEKLDNFQVILTDQSRVVTPFGRAINREMSTSWRGRSGAAGGYRGGVEAWLDELTHEVKLIDKSETKLSGRSVTIPVTVQNNLVQPVGHLVLRLTSTMPTRLKIGGKAYSEQRVEVSGGHSQSVKFTTSANANGRVGLIAQLYTEDGQEYGDPVSFDVKVTEVTPTVMLVIGGGVLLLVLAGFRMYTQRKRATSRQAEEDGPGTAGEDTDEPGNPEAPADRLPEEPEESGPASGAGDPEQPSDPAPDTAPENADPSGTGERVDR